MAPLLPLDGGHAMIATYEQIREMLTGRHYRLNAARLLPVTWIVLAGLLFVGIWSLALDIFQWPPV